MNLSMNCCGPVFNSDPVCNKGPSFGLAAKLNSHKIILFYDSTLLG